MRARGRCRRCGRTERAHSDLETAQNALSHSAHTHHLFTKEKSNEPNHASHTKILTLPVGATKENSTAKGVNGNQDDKSALNAGAAYVYY